jgi:DUF1009 family protein
MSAASGVLPREDAGLQNRARPIGLLAGAGRFPVAFAEKARALGIPVVCVALRHMASEELQAVVDRCYWTHVGRMGFIIRCFRKGGAREWVMAGKVPKSDVLHGRWRVARAFPDWRMIRMFYTRLRDQRDDSILSSIVDEFAADGLQCRSALEICPELLVRAGTLTRRGPSAAELKDIEFGWSMAKEMGRLDVGQSVMVRDQAVLAVEAIEGTDRAIQRAGELCPRGGFTVVKVAKPQQDMRFDVPTIGVTTIETIHRSGGRVLAIEADKTIVLDAPETVALADRYGIAIVAR